MFLEAFLKKVKDICPIKKGSLPFTAIYLYKSYKELLREYSYSLKQSIALFSHTEMHCMTG